MGCARSEHRFRLLQPPSLGLLAPMMVTTERFMTALVYMLVELVEQLMARSPEEPVRGANCG